MDLEQEILNERRIRLSEPARQLLSKPLSGLGDGLVLPRVYLGSRKEGYFDLVAAPDLPDRLIIEGISFRNPPHQILGEIVNHNGVYLRKDMPPSLISGDRDPMAEAIRRGKTGLISQYQEIVTGNEDLGKRLGMILAANFTPNQVSPDISKFRHVSEMILTSSLRILKDISYNKKVQENEQLRKWATLDDKSGLCNDRIFRLDLESCLNWVKEEGHPQFYNLILADVDSFKKINDSHGHIVGNIVISNIGNYLKKSIENINKTGNGIYLASNPAFGTGDFIGNKKYGANAYRLGGDEFAILFGVNSKEIYLEELRNYTKYLTEKIRKEVKKINAGLNLEISLSIGIMEANPGLVNGEQWFSETDKVLYLAKQGEKRLWGGYKNRGDKVVYKGKDFFYQTPA